MDHWLLKILIEVIEGGRGLIERSSAGAVWSKMCTDLHLLALPWITTPTTVESEKSTRIHQDLLKKCNYFKTEFQGFKISLT